MLDKYVICGKDKYNTPLKSNKSQNNSETKRILEYPAPFIL